MAVAVARSIIRDAVLVVKQDESDEDGADQEGQQAHEVHPRREIRVMHPRHALRCRQVHVRPAAESEEEANGTVLHIGNVYDNHAKDHAQARQEVQQERLRGTQADPTASEDGVVGQFLRDLVQHRGQGDAPAEAATAPLERRADEEAVAQVVEEVAHCHGAKHAGRRARAGRFRLIQSMRLGLQCPLDRALDRSWQDEPCEHHRPPAPKHLNLLLPTLPDEVRCLKQEQEERTREERARGEGGEHPFERRGVGRGEPREDGHSQSQADHRDQADNDRCTHGAAPIDDGFLLRRLRELGQRLHILAALVLQVVGRALELRGHVLREECHSGHAARVDRK
mmetsp:Transcript_68835/g.155966  ORF Transcript_68835/g.155966 Transcript_68835/m.155966 type:complete len:339 (+) Transcript_68835:149-1165(+)